MDFHETWFRNSCFLQEESEWLQSSSHISLSANLTSMLCNIICKMDPQSYGCRSEMLCVHIVPVCTIHILIWLPWRAESSSLSCCHCASLWLAQLVQADETSDVRLNLFITTSSCLLHDPLHSSLSASPTWTEAAGAAGDAHILLLHLLHNFSRDFVLKLYCLPQNVMNADRCMKRFSLMVCVGLAHSQLS